jgi:hypothetical protein
MGSQWAALIEVKYARKCEEMLEIAAIQAFFHFSAALILFLLAFILHLLE